MFGTLTIAMRLAWFTPWPPERHAAARRSRDAVHALALQGYAIDLFVEQAALGRAEHDTSLGVSVARASDFVARATGDAYDLAVYQIVNASAGAFIWPHLFERPGLVVLHESQVYAARSTRAASDPAAFRAEFGWNHPDVSIDAAELAVAGFDGAYASLWPMTRTVVANSRLVALSSSGVARELQDAWPETPTATVAPGIDAPTSNAADARAAFDIPDSAVVFGVAVHGGAAEDARQLAHIVRAYAGLAGRVPDTHLLVAGDVAPRSVAVSAGLSGNVAFAGPSTREQVARAITAADVWLDLRWPDHGATTDEWLTAIAAGRPTVVLDLAPVRDIPMLDPRSWQSSPDGSAPLGVAIDVLDEAHSLGLALYRLAIDGPLRDRLGSAAREYWRSRHTVAHMAGDFVRAIDRALVAPAPPRVFSSNAMRPEAPAAQV